jgi:hypothetical protein
MRIQGAIDFMIMEQTRERVVAEMPISSPIKDPVGVVHADAMLWFADVTTSHVLSSELLRLGYGPEEFEIHWREPMVRKVHAICTWCR